MTNSNHAPSRLKERLELSATILLIAVTPLVGGIALSDRLLPQPTRAVRPEPPLLAVSIRGDTSARVALIEFSDFEGPYWAAFAREVLPEVDRQYLRTAKAILVWRHLPLGFHENALKAAEAPECAGRQGKSWALPRP